MLQRRRRASFRSRPPKPKFIGPLHPITWETFGAVRAGMVPLPNTKYRMVAGVAPRPTQPSAASAALEDDDEVLLPGFEDQVVEPSGEGSGRDFPEAPTLAALTAALAPDDEDSDECLLNPLMFRAHTSPTIRVDPS